MQGVLPLSVGIARRREVKASALIEPQPAKALVEGQAIVAFDTTATKGIEEGHINSIIHPSLADHVRREAVKFVGELKRA